MDGPYLTVRLPSGRKMYYYRPRIVTKEFEGKDGTIFTREVLSYMGKNQFTHQWGRVYSSPGKQAENVTQATAREILAIGIRRAHEEGFNIVGSVHDEIICHQRKGDNYYTVDRLRDCMIAEIAWATGLPMDASGYSHTVYRKD
jgi:DNA polymerase